MTSQSPPPGSGPPPTDRTPPSRGAAPWVRPLALAGGLALCLGACGILPDPNLPVPDCPATGILGEAGDLRRFRGEGVDLTGLVLEARVIGASGSCRVGRSDPNQVIVAFRMGVEALRGPAFSGTEVLLPVFAAVANREGQVLGKEFGSVRIVWGPNLSRGRALSQEIEVVLPTGVPPRSLELLVGFQLTDAELATNRRLARR